jgi:hypothetical protein
MEMDKIETRGEPPRGRYRCTATPIGRYIAIVGGHDGRSHLMDAALFDPVADVWSSPRLVGGVPPRPRDSHAAVEAGGAVYVYGGNGGGGVIDDMFRLSVHEEPGGPEGGGGSVAWEHVEGGEVGRSGGGRFCHSAVAAEGRIWVFGGYNGERRLPELLSFPLPGSASPAPPVPPSTLAADLRALVGSREHADVTFLVEGEPVHAHRLLLSRSGFFRAMLGGGYAEGGAGGEGDPIPIGDVSRDVFLSLLEYLYTDDVSVPLESAMELFRAADLFCVSRLQAICEQRMLESMGPDNAAALFFAADLHSATALKEKVLVYILDNFEGVSKTDGFEDMARNNVELVLEILHRR